MSDTLIQFIPKEEVFHTCDQVEYQEGAIASKTLVNREQINLTILALDEKEELSTHSAPGDAYITLLDGSGHVFIDGVRYDLKKNESIVMPYGKPHSVHADERMKFQLILVKK